MKKLLNLWFLFALTGLFAQDFYNPGSQTVGDLLNSSCCWLGKYKISGSVGGFFSKITYLKQPGRYTDYQRYGTNANLTVKFYKEFQVRLMFYADFNQNDDKPSWLSNLYYNIGNYDWHNKSFSYGYENYQPNRFDGSYNFFENMKRGFFFVSYNYYLLGEGENPLKLDKTSQIYLSPFIRYQPEYTDRYGEKVLGYHKTVLGTAARYVIWNNFYVESAVYFYPVKKSKMPWDPDFTYGFGYFNWRSFKINFSYGNWIANRFPWNEKEMKNDFTNGEFKLLFNFIW